MAQKTERQMVIDKSYLPELQQELRLMNQVIQIPDTVPRPKKIRKAFEGLKKCIPTIKLTRDLLEKGNPVSYLLKDRQQFYKALPHLTMNQINTQAYQAETKVPDDLMVLNYTQWSLERGIGPAIMVLASLEDNLIWCLNWFRMDAGPVHWVPDPYPIILSMGLPFNKRSNRGEMASRLFGDAKALDECSEHMLPLGDDCCGESILEVFSLLGAYFYALNDKGTKIQEVVEGDNSYKVVVYKGHVV
jgi:hypothetical protein